MAEEGFDAGWLELREPVDHRSRRAELVPPLDRWLRETGGSRVLDLGAGTGSNLRYLEPRLSARTRWTLLDRDPALLARAPRSGVRHLHGDLAGPGLDAVADADLVTASALLDLVSRSWLERLVEAVVLAGAAALFALSWDGTARWLRDGEDVADPDDALVLEAVRAHQARDKGLGPALGPRGGEEAEALFRAAGLETRLLASPWRLRPDDAALTLHLIDGWEEAALEQAPRHVDRVRGSASRNRARVGEGGVELVVGHTDLLALPPGAR